MKKFIKPVSIIFVVLAVLAAGILIGGFALGKSSKAKPEVLKIATKSSTKNSIDNTNQGANNSLPQDTKQSDVPNQTQPKSNNQAPVNPAPPLATVQQLDQVSAAKLKVKIYQHTTAISNISTFIKIYNENHYFEESYLDSALFNINQSKSYDSAIKTNGILAEAAFMSCKLADQHFLAAIQNYKNFVKDTNDNFPGPANLAFQLASSSEDYAINTSKTCSGYLTDLGF